jgi:predicted amidophosphoribosyltransferase
LQAITQAARVFANAIGSKWLDGATLIPVPPSKALGDPTYDDRMTQVCRCIRATPALDVRELVVQHKSMPAAHESQQRPTVDDLLQVWEIDERLADPFPRWIGVFDDVLTAGTHFVAMKTILSKRFPEVAISGFFIARRVFPPSVDESNTLPMF